MQLHASFDTLRRDRPTALTIGAFDGIHLGHCHLIGAARRAADRIGGQCVVITFDPHPDLVLRPDRERLYLTSLPERIALIEALQVDHLIVLPFDPELARVTAEGFMEQVCHAMDLRELWIGPDFRMGAGGKGTLEVLARIGHRLGYTVHQAERFLLDDQPVSSTMIRELLASGRVDAAARLLGRPFVLEGEVIHGDQRGRTIGVPTANLAVPAEQLLPADGVYASHVRLPGDTTAYPAVTNVGVRPTFGALRRTVESHLLDWSGDIYGETIRVAFLQRLRGEQKFAGIEALVAQIRADIAAARELLATAPSDDPPAS